MRAKDKERLARRQRMLARERGEPLPDVFAPPPRGRSRPKGADPDPGPPPPGTPSRIVAMSFCEPRSCQ